MKSLWFLIVFLPILYNGFVGLQIPILNSSKGVIENYLFAGSSESPWAWSSLVMLYHLGMVLGSFFAAQTMDKYGRKLSLMVVSNVLNIIGSLFCLTAWASKVTWMMFLGRFILGTGGGFVMATLPVYLLEFTPKAWWGLAGGILDTWMTVGVLAAGILARSDVLGSTALWPWLVTIGLWPAILGLALTPLCYDTPVSIYTRTEDSIKSVKSWKRYNGKLTTNEEETALLDDIKLEAEGSAQISWMLCFSQYRFQLLVGALLGFCSATTGTPMLISYSTPFLIRAGVGQAVAQTITNVLGVAEVVGGLLSALVNHLVSRRFAMTVTLAVCAVGNVLLWLILFLSQYLAMAWLLVAGTTMFSVILVVATNIGPSGLVPVLCVELSPLVARAKTRTLSVSVGVLLRVILDLISWPIYDVSGPTLFIVFGMTCAVCCVCFNKILPQDIDVVD